MGLLSSASWTPTDDFELIAGLDLDFTEGYLSEEQFITVPFGGFAQGVHYNYDVFASVVAPYVHTEWQALDWARVVAGLRAEYTNYVYDNNADVKLTATGADRYIRPADRVDDFLTLTPKLGFVFDLTPQTTAFVNFARGARAPQTTDLYRVQQNQQPGDADPERVNSVEAGLRGRIGPVSGQIAAFFMQKKNFFFRDADGFNVTNGKTRHEGIEVETVIDLPANLTLAGAASYARHTYRFNRTVSGGGRFGNRELRRRCGHRAPHHRQCAPCLAAASRLHRRAGVAAYGQLCHQCLELGLLSRP